MRTGRRRTRGAKHETRRGLSSRKHSVSLPLPHGFLVLSGSSLTPCGAGKPGSAGVIKTPAPEKRGAASLLPPESLSCDLPVISTGLVPFAPPKRSVPDAHARSARTRAWPTSPARGRQAPLTHFAHCPNLSGHGACRAAILLLAPHVASARLRTTSPGLRSYHPRSQTLLSQSPTLSRVTARCHPTRRLRASHVSHPLLRNVMPLSQLPTPCLPASLRFPRPDVP